VTEHSRIDAELDGARLSLDGSRLILLLHDAAGQKVSLSLPTQCLSAVLTAAPQPVACGTVHSVETWSMSSGKNGQDMILTLCTPEGMVMSFALKSWQAESMATVATHVSTRNSVGRSVH
jgi:hypothetical protein